MSEKNDIKSATVRVCLVNVDTDGKVVAKGGEPALGLCALDKDGSEICIPFTVRPRPNGLQYIGLTMLEANYPNAPAQK